jgi:hypothetical protein
MREVTLEQTIKMGNIHKEASILKLKDRQVFFGI